MAGDWRNGFGINEREQQHVHMKSQPKNEKYANGSVGAKVRLMVRGGCFPGMEWKGNMMMISVCVGQLSGTLTLMNTNT